MERGKVMDDLTRVLLSGVAHSQRMSQHFATELLKEVRHGEPVYLTRAVDGITLKQHFRTMGRQPEVSPESLREKADELFTALDWLRGKGYFHADLTLENIMIDRSSGKLVLIDLESIQRLDAGTQEMSANGLRELKELLAHHLGD